VPSNGVDAVLVNMTVTQAAGPGYFTIWGAGAKRPASSNLNAPGPGATRSNAAITALGSGGAVSVYSETGSHALIDVFGYFVN
jgi:hypothetical protein